MLLTRKNLMDGLHAQEDRTRKMIETGHSEADEAYSPSPAEWHKNRLKEMFRARFGQKVSVTNSESDSRYSIE